MPDTPRESALVLANGLYQTDFAKTTHGLVRGPSRFPLRGVVDPENAGRDAGELLDGRHRDLPIFASVDELVDAVGDPAPTHCLVGVATPGGVLPPDLKESLLSAARRGMTLVNGLHRPLSGDPDIAAAVAEAGGEIVDFRKPRPISEMAFWSGEIYKVKALRVPVLGTDCAIGKRTTATLLMQACKERGLRAEMIYTGQTGWLQGHRHGFLFDATPNDFVPGELERAIVNCDREQGPDIIFIEGQASLRNPSGPCGSELIISAAASGVILQHVPGREHYIDLEEVDARIPPVDSEIDLIRRLGADVWALTLNTSCLAPDTIEAVRDALAEELGIPVLLPLRAEDIASLVDLVAGHLPA